MKRKLIVAFSIAGFFILLVSSSLFQVEETQFAIISQFAPPSFEPLVRKPSSRKRLEVRSGFNKNNAEWSEAHYRDPWNGAAPQAWENVAMSVFMRATNSGQ